MVRASHLLRTRLVQVAMSLAMIASGVLAVPSPGFADHRERVLTRTDGPAKDALPRLRVSLDRRRLETEDGKPFFWLADTAWNLLKLSPDEVDVYFADRVAKGFTAILGPIVIGAIRPPSEDVRGQILSDEQRSALYEFSPNFAGQRPLVGARPRRQDADPGRWNEVYLRHLAWIVRRAEEHGLYMTIPVIWGPQVDWVFSVDDPKKAESMAQELGRYFVERKNVIWIVSGEYHKIARDYPWSDTVGTVDEKQKKLLRAIAQGLHVGHGGRHLMTIHPTGNASSSQDFHRDEWLDFNMIQTYSVRNNVREMILSDWRLRPAKPTVNAEPAYEGRVASHVCQDGAWFFYLNDAYMSRYQAYTSVFQGAFGHAYGHEQIWAASDGWRAALDALGGSQMTYLRMLMESRPSRERIRRTDEIGGNRWDDYIRFEVTDPAAMPKAATCGRDSPTMTAGDFVMRTQWVEATGAANGAYLMVYFPSSHPDQRRTINLGLLSGSRVNAWWYSPRDGKVYDNDGKLTELPFTTLSSTERPTFNPPTSDVRMDWVLVLDDVEKNFGVPGRGSDSP